MASTGEVYSHRRATLGAGIPLAAPLLASLAIADMLREYRPNDVTIGVTAGRLLLGGDLEIYAHMPEAQIGPLALLLAGGLPRPLYVALVCALLPTMLAVVRLASRCSRVTLGVGGLLLAWPWALYALEGHADDAIVALCAAVMVREFRRHPGFVGVAFVVAVAAKPTAVLFLPLVALSSGRAALWSVAGAAAAWSPFVLADVSGFLAAGGGVSTVQPWSLPGLLGSGVGEEFPWWVRPAQFVGGLALCWFIGKRRGASAAIVCVVAWRAILEPGAAPSYSVAIIAAALLIDTAGREFPSLAAAAWGSWVLTYVTAYQWFHEGDPGVVGGWLRVVLIALVGLTAATSELDNGHVRVVRADRVGATSGSE